MKIDQIIRSQRKTIALIVQQNGQLVVRAPIHMTDRQIADLVDQQTDWIQTRQKEIQKNSLQTAPKKFTDGETFWYLG